MKILVTGASGFIGSNLCHKMKEIGMSFHGVDNLSFGNRDNLPSDIRFTEVGFEKINEDYLNNFDILVHLATSNIIYAMSEPIETVKNNAVETIKLFQRFKGKIIYTSTASVYGNAELIPTREEDEIKLSNGYDTSKYIAELFLRERGNFTTLRLSNVYGRFQDSANPYCGVLGKFVDQYLAGKPFTIYGNGVATRDYTYVDDVVDAILLAIEQLPCETEINIATSKQTSILEIVGIINEEHEVERLPQRSIDAIQHRCLDISLAEKLLGWTPEVDVSEGIKRLIEIKKKG